MPTELATSTTVTARAWRELLEFLLKETSDRKLALRCASEIHGPVCMFGNSQQSPARSKKLAPGKALRPLQRLERTVKSGGVEWEDAWTDLTLAAFNCLRSGNTGKAVPLTFGVPKPADIAPLIPGALACARTRSKALTERKIAVVPILRAYRSIYKKRPTPKRAATFIGKIEKIYGDLLPAGGFNVGQTTTLQKLIREAFGGH